MDPDVIVTNIYQVATKTTQHKSELKAIVNQSLVESSCRGPGQVLACSMLSIVILLVHIYLYGEG